jgi:hypothetical protein
MTLLGVISSSTYFYITFAVPHSSLLCSITFSLMLLLLSSSSTILLSLTRQSVLWVVSKAFRKSNKKGINLFVLLCPSVSLSFFAASVSCCLINFHVIYLFSSHKKTISFIHFIWTARYGREKKDFFLCCDRLVKNIFLLLFFKSFHRSVAAMLYFWWV